MTKKKKKIYKKKWNVIKDLTRNIFKILNEDSSKSYNYKQIAEKLNVSASAIEKRIIPLYKRFNVKSLPHLISFAYDNHIL